MPADFVHLHVHSHYSLLDGACTTAGLLELAKRHEMAAVAITDHGFMGGAQDMYKTFQGSGVKPIIGCEAYVTPQSRLDKNPSSPYVRGMHLLLLAENNEGYHNLCKLLSEGFRTGLYYGKPRLDKELLREFSGGLIAASACIAGEIPQMLLNNDAKGAEKALKEYLDIFGAKNFFLELMDHGMEEEKTVNRGLLELAKKFELPLIATNDVHYLEKEHARAHEIMLCIQTASKLSEPNHFSFPAPEFYFKSPAEMAELFKEVPEALSNTRMVAERCDVTFKYVPEVNHYPVFKLDDGTVPGREYLRDLCLDRMPHRYGFDGRAADLSPERQAIIARMDYEIGVIDKSNYCSYFLVVSDFIRYARAQGIPVGPGRGSGAGSIVAFLSGITNIDPLRYNLLFERFLNPERVSPPDFDIDFCENRRVEVIDYVRNKYGSDSVAQICTYGALKTKAVIKDVARVLGLDFEFGNRINKLVPEGPKTTLESAQKESKELAALIESDPRVEEVFQYAKVLEGLNRQLGIHAAGVIIGDQRLDDLVPLACGANGEIITQYTAGPCEELGLLKMDFLGLRTLTIIQNAVNMIASDFGARLDMDALPLNDPKTFELLQRGDTIAVFQLESGGMQNLCRQFGVETIEHIIALLAIYRPGPMQFIPQFIRRKKGEEPIVYDHPLMEPILKETYGIMLYQEQIMQVVQVLAGFTLGASDILRRAIGKKKKDEMARQKAKFIKGCADANGIHAALAEAIWDKIDLFAGYGFNKSHSAAYAIVAYQTAYLKANYPVQFMAAVLTSELANADQIAFLITACREMGLAILPPDVNTSRIAFGVDGGAIRFGLGAIKGVGEVAAGKILEAREGEGKFTSFQNFCERCGSAINSRMLENLVRAGALDAFDLRRSQLLAIAEPMMKFSASRAADRAQGQASLFDLLSGDEAEADSFSVPIPDIPEFSLEEILENEKQLLGFYVSAHPLDPYTELLRAFSSTKIRDLDEGKDNSSVRLTGMVGSYTSKISRNGKPMGILLLEDFDAAIECMLYGRIIEQLDQSALTLAPGLPIIVEASISKRDENERPKVVVDRILPLADAPNEYAEELHWHLSEEDCDRKKLEALLELCRLHPGRVRLVLCVVCPEDSVTFIRAAERHGVNPTLPFLEKVDALVGPGRYRFKAKPHQPVRPRNHWREKNGNGNGNGY